MRALILAAAAIGWAGAASAQPAPPPVEAFGRLPAISDAAISPDGSKVALAMSQGARSAIRVVDLDQHRIIYTAAVDDNSDLRGVGWADDAHISFVMSRTFLPGQVLPAYVRFVGHPHRVVYYRTGLIDLATQRPRMLTTNADDEWQDQGAALIAPIEGDPGYGRMLGRAPGMESAMPGVFKVSIASGRTQYLGQVGVNRTTLRFVLDSHGEVGARIDSDEHTNHWRVFTYDGRQPRLLLEGDSPTGAPVNIQGLLPDGRLVSLDEDENGEFFGLYAIDRANGQKQMLFQREGFEVDDAIADPWTREIVGVTWTEEERKQEFFDAALRDAYAHVGPLLENATVSLMSWSRDRRRFLVYAEIGLDGGGYYVYNANDNSIARISMRYPELAQALSGERQSITYPARDGTRIPAYLTLPDVEDRRNLPLVLLVHGGPHHIRDRLDFDFWAAFLASRGYAVLQPNFRGSGGYGASWEDRGRRQWGGLMQTDVEDGVVALIRAHMVDPARVCIVGASYGGYAALAGATLTPDRYKCAASVAGVSDLLLMLSVDGQQYGRESMTADFWRLSIGDSSADRERIRSVSPANLADRVHIPILLIHGTNDTVVPIEQSRRMRDRLQAAGKDVRYVELQGDDHYLSDATTRTQMLQELETFLAANLNAR
ncbi:MAG TPA: alpha/beta fold hydrolase [Caulobacterales bacterium]|nr:alpha/beta fold hydrolase [Caulobacterales bacterium]